MFCVFAFSPGLPTTLRVLRLRCSVMRSIFEFALIAWVGISIVAVLVQLIRIARYKRAGGAAPVAESQVAKSEAPTINLGERLASTQAADATTSTPNAMASAANAERGASSTAAPSTPTTEPARPAAEAAQAAAAAPRSETPPATPATPSTPAAPSEPQAAPSTAPTQAPPSADTAPTTSAATEATATPDVTDLTLADLLAGVRLPWNLLPTIDQGREPSNDRVALITSEGDPADIGVDVADELERLGFAIAPRGDDTAVATRGEHSLGLQIIENPMDAEIDGTRRFPTATESSVALDIWVEVNVTASA